MLHILKKTREENLRRPFVYTRIVDNRMTIVGHRLFKHSRNLHLALIVHRLRRDFGFTWYEVANFTGIPIRDLSNLYRRLKPLLDDEILKTLVRIDYFGELNTWRSIPAHGRPQGYYEEGKDRPAWYKERKRKKDWNKEPLFKLGTKTETEYLGMLEKTSPPA